MIGSCLSYLNVEHQIQLVGTPDPGLERLYALNRMVESEGMRRHQGHPGFASLGSHRTSVGGRSRQGFLDQQRLSSFDGKSTDLR
jgi:hypothetical protein